MESHREEPGVYTVKAVGEVWRVRRNDGGWWEIHCYLFGGWEPYSDYNKFNTKASAMLALSKRHGYWEERQ